MELSEQICEAADAVRGYWNQPARIGIVLGTGLSQLATQIEADCCVPCHQIPHLPSATALGHKGQWVCGKLGSVPVIALDGRFHRYEGYSLQQITLPIRIMRQLGVDTLILSNASGGVSPRLNSGDILVIDDHLNLMWDNPLIGPNEETLGPRFPDMSRPYNEGLITAALEIARQRGYAASRGVYAAFTGPNYETRAEYRMLRYLGADVIGMSTVPEVIVAAQAGMRVLALSVVTNVCQPDTLGTTSGSEVLEIARSTEPKVTDLVQELITSRLAAETCGNIP
ncbi:MAG: purine-nucleoside phosphorylase [Planctomycetales bacterium]|nr:purine-nucleoside phosphorylase [Planctomycetales bacterium]